MPTNSSPMPVSSDSRVVRCTRLTPPTMTTALTIAPSDRSNPQMAARAMPGSTPWASASPKNASPRTTTHVPIERRRRRGEQAADERPLGDPGREGVGDEVDQRSAPATRSALVRIMST